MKPIIKYIFLCLAGIISLSSCNDWLDVKPSDELDRSDLLKNENGYAEALTGVYASMSKPELYGRTLTWYVPEILAGYYAMTGSSIAYWQEFSYKHSNENRNETAIELIDGIWLNLYNCIANLNSMLDEMDGQEGLFTGDNYNIMKGEAIGLRAYLHFELLRMFGEPYAIGRDNEAIPFVDHLSTEVFPILTVDEALTRIINDLNTARELLANDPIHLGTSPSEVLAPIPSDPYGYSSNQVEPYHNRRFRFNYYAALGTLARAYLWKGDKTNALNCAREVIADQSKRFPWVKSSNLTNIGKTDSYSYNQDRTFATEHLFAMNVEKLEEYIDGWTYQGENRFDANILSVSYAGENFYEGNDIRKQYLMTDVGWNKYSSKYYQTHVVLHCFQKRIPLIRVSEMYYIAAECTGDADEALSLIDEVRQHRGLNDMPLTSSASVQDELQKEYQKEFLGEGQLWFYYKRNMASYIPNAWNFTGDLSLYTFDHPEDEDVYGGRIKNNQPKN